MTHPEVSCLTLYSSISLQRLLPWLLHLESSIRLSSTSSIPPALLPALVARPSDSLRHLPPSSSSCRKCCECTSQKKKWEAPHFSHVTDILGGSDEAYEASAQTSARTPWGSWATWSSTMNPRVVYGPLVRNSLLFGISFTESRCTFCLWCGLWEGRGNARFVYQCFGFPVAIPVLTLSLLDDSKEINSTS